jgi:hypothetical protein
VTRRRGCAQDGVHEALTKKVLTQDEKRQIDKAAGKMNISCSSYLTAILTISMQLNPKEVLNHAYGSGANGRQTGTR